MALIPGKLFAKSCTKMSLNERFTAYREQAESASANFRGKIMQQRQASAENRRLAQQMANRPSVIAALKLKKKSLQQRLGQQRNTIGTTHVKARLNLRASPKIQSRLGPRGRGRGVPRFSRRAGGNRGNRQGFVRQSTAPMIKARLGLSPMNVRKFSSRGFGRNKNFFDRTRQNNNPPPPKFKRGGGRGRGQSTRGGRSRWSRVKPMPSKQDLDNELDRYMAETKIEEPFGY